MRALSARELLRKLGLPIDFFFRPRETLIIFLMVFCAYAYQFHKWRFWGVNSRVSLTYAIVDEGTFRVDSYVNHPHYYTEDRALYNGHYYSDKAIGLSLLGVPVYYCMKQFASLFGKDSKPDFSRYGMTVAVVSLSGALLIVVLFKFLVLLGVRRGMASWVALVFAFGTLLFPFSCLFYPYLPALLFLIGALYLIVSRQLSGWLDKRSLFSVGVLIGAGLLCEYTLAVPAGLILLYLLIYLRKRIHFLSCLLGVAIPLSLLAYYNWRCFGTPFTLAYSHLENPEFAAGMKSGFMGIGRFQWYVLYLITISPYRGVFFYSPVLFLAFVGIWRGLVKPAPQRALAGLIALTVLYYLVLVSSYYMWWGGGTLLCRHLAWMLPFLALAFAWYPERVKWLLIALGIISIALMFVQSVVEPHFEAFYSNEQLYHPYDYVRTTGKGFVPPFVRRQLPLFARGDLSLNYGMVVGLRGKWSLLPLLVFELVAGVILYRRIR
jgi:hypothetical protein